MLSSTLPSTVSPAHIHIPGGNHPSPCDLTPDGAEPTLQLHLTAREFFANDQICELIETGNCSDFLAFKEAGCTVSYDPGPGIVRFQLHDSNRDWQEVHFYLSDDQVVSDVGGIGPVTGQVLRGLVTAGLLSADSLRPPGLPEQTERVAQLASRDSARDLDSNAGAAHAIATMPLPPAAWVEGTRYKLHGTEPQGMIWLSDSAVVIRLYDSDTQFREDKGTICVTYTIDEEFREQLAQALGRWLGRTGYLDTLLRELAADQSKDAEMVTDWLVKASSVPYSWSVARGD
jgi:hypothetical protein